MPPSRSLITKLISFIRRKTSQKYKFNLQYEANKWDGLKGLAELSRYGIITGYSRFFCTNARILDLGCGEGVLQQKFPATDYAFYLGIDFSEVAIENARKLENHKTKFQVGDLNKFNTTEKFDVIIYNESLYYLSNPKDAVQSLFKNLNPGGVFIISMVDRHGQERESLWNKLDEIMDIADKTKTTNMAGASWTIKVYKVRD